MTGVRFLDCVYGKKPNGIDTQLVELRWVKWLAFWAHCGITLQGISPPDL
jgi:hypothetical protein